MPAAPRSCLHTHGGQDGGRDLYRGLQHHPRGSSETTSRSSYRVYAATSSMPPLREVSGTCRGRIPVPAPLLRASIQLQQGRTGPPGCRQRRRASRPRRGRSSNDVFDGSSSFIRSPRKRLNPGSGVAWRTSAGHLAGHNVPRRALDCNEIGDTSWNYDIRTTSSRSCARTSVRCNGGARTSRRSSG